MCLFGKKKVPKQNDPAFCTLIVWSIQAQALTLHEWKKGSYLKWLPNGSYPCFNKNSVSAIDAQYRETSPQTRFSDVCRIETVLLADDSHLQSKPLYFFLFFFFCVLLKQRTRSALNWSLLAVVFIMQASLEPGFPLTHTGPSILRVLAYATPVFLSLIDQCYSWEKAQKSILVLGTLTV